MNLDFLGQDPANNVIGEVVEIKSDTIILKRGFFFMEDIELYDADGNPIDKQGYSFDLPIPSISSRTGRFIFGRILLSTSITPVTIDYKTPYYVEDNRIGDIEEFIEDKGITASMFFYNHFTRLFRESDVPMDGATITPWLESLSNLVTAFRNRIIPEDILLNTIDEVFTRGIIRYPDTLDVSSISNSAFIGSEETTSTLNLSKWNAEWTVNSNTFRIDYKFMRLILAQQLSNFERKLSAKYQGNFIADMNSVSADMIRTDDIKPVVSTLGYTPRDDINIISGEVDITGLDQGDHYLKLFNLIDTVGNLSNTIIDNYDALSDLDEDMITIATNSMKSVLMDGYTAENIDIRDGRIRFGDVYFNNHISSSDFVSALNDLSVSGDKPTSTNLDTLKSKLTDRIYSIDFNDMRKELSKIAFFGADVLTILDGMSITKLTFAHSITTHSLEDIL